jgi:hypothetical protein
VWREIEHRVQAKGQPWLSEFNFGKPDLGVDWTLDQGEIVGRTGGNGMGVADETPWKAGDDFFVIDA